LSSSLVVNDGDVVGVISPPPVINNTYTMDTNAKQNNADDDNDDSDSISAEEGSKNINITGSAGKVVAKPPAGTYHCQQGISDSSMIPLTC